MDVTRWIRRYLYVGSFAGVALLAIGLSSLVTAAIALLLGTPLVYGGLPVEAVITTAERQAVQRDQDAIRGVTFAVCGLLFWAGHWVARNRVGPGDRGAGRRAYAVVGTAVYAVATIVLLPAGIAAALTFVLVPAGPGGYRAGAGQSLGGGLVTLGVWLLYLRLLVDDLPRGSRTVFHGGGGGPPAEPVRVGARIGPAPGGRSAGAEARPPVDPD